ncbi:Uncharacterized conserved protein [uncultured Blautia sp.]|nr:DUF3846 domain-containing protein [uncultured Blautia sp.]VEJ96641.1 Uncharacterized conserved protein [uncultured Blautia sp.]
MEQRSGRIVRQGNENPQVDIYRYVTEQTFDAYLYQLVEGKQKFASQIMTSKSPVRSAEDIDETALSYAEIKMLATGNPYIKEKMDLDIQVQKLKMLKSNFLSEKYGLEDKVIKFYPQQIAYLKSRVEGLTKDVETAKLHPKPIDEQPLGMMVSGVSYSEKAEAGQAIINTCKSMNSPDAIPLGEYRGFQMELYFDTVQRNYVVKLKGETSRDVPLGDDAHGNIVRIDNGIERFEEALADTKNSLENTEKQFETAKQEIEKPFAKEEELRAKTARLDELNILLNMDKIKVLLVEPEKYPKEIVIDDSLEAMQEVVGGDIEEYMPYDDDVAIICNEEGKMRGLPLNRAVYVQDNDKKEMVDIICGKFFICYASPESESFQSLPDDMMKKYKEQFKYPERFSKEVGGNIVAEPFKPKSKDYER